MASTDPVELFSTGSTAQSAFPSATACIAPRKETQGTISQMSDHFPVGERAAK